MSIQPDLMLVSDNTTITWKLIKSWPDDQVQILFNRMHHVPLLEFDYEQVYHGKSIIIFYDDIIGQTVNKYPYLKFHISNDRYFGSQYGLIYLKHLDRDIKRIIDSKIQSVVETGLNSHWQAKTYSKRLNFFDFDPSHQSISMTDFKKILMLFLCVNILMIIILFVEYLYIRAYLKKRNLNIILQL